MVMDDIERLWTHEETSTFLHISPWTLTHLVGQQAGPTVFRVGRNRRYDPVDVRSWLYLSASRSEGRRAEAGRHARTETDSPTSQVDSRNGVVAESGPVT
jgi:hypothetical protein